VQTSEGARTDGPHDSILGQIAAREGHRLRQWTRGAWFCCDT
jgi:hypothetical protein